MLLRGVHTVNVISQNPVEAEEIAEEVFYRMMEFTQAIRHEFNLNKFVLDDMGEPVKIEESKEHWNVPITITTQLQTNWVVKPIGPLLKTVSLNAASIPAQ